jgi:pilus assembly protein CpaD
MVSFEHSKARRRTVVVRAVALITAAVTLSACYTPRDETGAVPSDYRLRHPITVGERDRSMVLFVGANRGGLTPAERAEVGAFAHAWRHEATGGIIIDVPVGTRSQAAAAVSLREVRSIFTAVGIPPHVVKINSYTPKDATTVATITLNYPKVAATAGPCGLWPADLGPAQGVMHAENQPYYNLGCASQRNLAAMVANPADLVQPRAESAAYASRRNTVFDKYRRGESTATTYPEVNGAKISDVGK